MKTRWLTTLVSSFVLGSLPGSEAKKKLEIQQVSCNNGFSVVSYQSSCTRCQFGTSANFYANVYAQYGLPVSTGQIKLDRCWLSGGYFCTTIADQDSVEFCNFFEPADRQSCPAVGHYTVDNSFQLPGDDGHNWVVGAKVYYVAYFKDSNGNLHGKCEIKYKVVQSSYTSSNYSGATLLGVVALAGIAVRWRFNRRRVQEQSESESSQGDFEMMDDPVTNSRVV